MRGLNLTSPAFVGALGGGAPQTFRYFRLWITANGGDPEFLGMYTMGLYGTVGGATIAIDPADGTASASSEYNSNYFAGKAFDGDTGTLWLSASYPSYPQWIMFDFGSPTSVAEYGVCEAYDDGTNNDQSAKDWTFQGSDDNSVWTDLDTQANVIPDGIKRFEL